MVESLHSSTEVASTGISELDAALGGLYWGDNVVWEVHGDVTVAPFYEAVAALRPAFDVAAYATLTADGDAVGAAYPGFEVLDARPGAELHRPGALLEAIVKRCDRRGRNLLMFDPLDAMVGSWGAETAARFFARCCPLLLDVGAVAYWSLSAGDVPPALRRTVEQVTQCMLAVSDDRLRVSKAEGRGPAVVGRVFRWRLEDGLAILSPAPAAARIGAALRQLRSERGMSQSELARVAGISPSAVSQAERGARGLSLETLLELTTKLNVTLDELLHGDVSAGSRLGRLGTAPHGRAGQAAPDPLLDDPKAGLRAYVVHPRAPGICLAARCAQGDRAHRRGARARSGRALGRDARTSTGRRAACRARTRPKVAEPGPIGLAAVLGPSRSCRHLGRSARKFGPPG